MGKKSKKNANKAKNNNNGGASSQGQPPRPPMAAPIPSSAEENQSQVDIAAAPTREIEESKVGDDKEAAIMTTENTNAAGEKEAGTLNSKDDQAARLQLAEQHDDQAVVEAALNSKVEERDRLRAGEQEAKAKAAEAAVVQKAKKERVVQADKKANATAEDLKTTDEQVRWKAEQDAKAKAEAVHRAKERAHLEALEAEQKATSRALEGEAIIIQKAEEQARRKEAKQVAEALKKQTEQARFKAEQEAKVAAGVHRAKERVRLKAEQNAKEAAKVAQRAEEQARRKAETLANFSSPPKSARKISLDEARLLRVATKAIKKVEEDAREGVPSLPNYGAKSPSAKKAGEYTKADVESSKATKKDVESTPPVATGVASPAANHAKSKDEISESAKIKSEANYPVAKKMEQHTKLEVEILKMETMDEQKKVHPDDAGAMLKVEKEKKTDADNLTEDANAFGEELLRKAEEQARRSEEDMNESVIEMSRGHDETEEEEITSRGGRHISPDTNVSPAYAGLRWVVLAAICLVMASTSYSYDIPAALHAQLQEYMEDHSKEEFELEFNLLYTVYSIPNIILPFIGGTLVDQLGASFMVPVLASFCVVGQAIFTLGTAQKHWRLMLLGRIVYGLGGESTYVACSTVLSQWFAGKEMAFAFGLAIALCKMGSVFNNLLSPVVAESKTTPSALWVGLGVNSLGLILGIFIFCLDRKFRKRPQSIVVDENDDSLTEPLLSGNGTETEVPDSTTLEASSTHGAGGITRMSSLFWLLSLSCLVVYGCVLPFNNVASAILLERNYFKTPPDDCQLLYPNECTSGTLQDHPNPSTDSNGQSCPGPHYAPILPTSLNITRIEHAYYKESLSHVEVDCEVSFWSQDCTRDYCEASDRASLTADRVMSIPYIVSAIVSPILGLIVDKVGKRALLAFLAPLVLFMVHMALAIGDASPILPLLGQGLSYALFGAVLWPSVPLTVEPSLAGTAFGIINSIQNIGLGVFPLVVAEIHNRAGQYLPHVEYFFCACAFMGGLVGIWLNLLDGKHGNKLNSVDGKGYFEESPSPARGAAEDLNVSEIV